MAGKPDIAFDVNAWMSDEGLRRCSLAARGLWIDILCLMAKCPERGFLISASGVAWTQDEVVGAIAGDKAALSAALAELLALGIVSRDSRAALFCRKMVRDEKRRQAMSANGKKGGNPHLKNGVKPWLKPGDKPAKNGGDLSFSSLSSEVFQSKDPKTENHSSNGARSLEWWLETIYQAFPRHVAKRKAKEEIALAIKAGKDPQWLLDKTREFATSDKGRSIGEPCPYPATWFHQGRYDDDPAEWKAKPVVSLFDRKRVQSDENLRRFTAGET